MFLISIAHQSVSQITIFRCDGDIARAGAAEGDLPTASFRRIMPVGHIIALSIRFS